ncbi:alpha/beta-hydrolase [Aureobasidium pullulans]|nr:alpha/beta-hydrolase [Aureobasidium pullulans]
MPDSNAIYPFHLSIPQSELDDLQTRLRLTRWPDKETVSDDSQGVPLATMKELCLYWQNEYNWRKCEDLLNSYPQFTTTIDGVEIYFLHIRSKHENALPMLLTHGWPGSVLEFRHVIDKLIDPEDPEDAFHLIIPALPGYAFSGKPTETGWGIKRTAKAWVELMSRLGYTEASWVAQGGDWGAHISACLGNMAPKGQKAIHLNSIFLEPKKEILTPTQNKAGENRALDFDAHRDLHHYGYYTQQKTRPQTLGYGLASSPIAQASWIYEKLLSWSDHKPSSASSPPFTTDEILDNISLYWFSNSATSSARFYFECEFDSTAWEIKLPVGVSWFPGDTAYGPREWCERYYGNIVHWREMERGGHFAAWEVPDLFVAEVREWRGKIKG